MKTISVQIGNTDNKLTQQKWDRFVNDTNDIMQAAGQVYFMGGPSSWEFWQNAAWIVELEDNKIAALENSLSKLAGLYQQDSIAVTVGDTKFITIRQHMPECGTEYRGCSPDCKYHDRAE